jgi:hypothetical protein
MAGTRWVVMLHQGMWEGTSVPVAVCHTEASGAEFVKAAQAWADETRERWHDILSESDAYDYEDRDRRLKRTFPDRREDGDVPHELFGWLDPTEHADYELVELPSVSDAD